MKTGDLARLTAVGLILGACVLGACRQRLQRNASILRMSVSLYRVPTAQELSEGETLQAGAKVKVESKRSPWVLVRSGDVEGWLPEWYLTSEPPGEVVEGLEPYCMVVREEAVLRGWVNQNFLVNLEEGHPGEGKILPGTVVFFGDPYSEGFNKMTREKISQVMIVYLGQEIGNTVHVSGAGGWDGWVSRSDVIFDPF